MNLIITSGLFYSALDLHTPLLAIYNFYDTVLSPYYDLFLNKYKDLSNIDVESNLFKHNSLKPSSINTELVDNDLTNKMVNNSESFLEKYKNYIATASVLFILWFFLGLPGPSIDPREIDKYNFINQSLIKAKILIRDVFNFFFTSNGGTGTSGAAASAGINNNINQNIELNDLRSSPASSGSNTPLNPTSNLPNPNIPSSSGTSASYVNNSSGSNLSSNNLVNNYNTKIDKGTQTYINGMLVGNMLEVTNTLQLVLDKDAESTLLEHVNSKIKNITD